MPLVAPDARTRPRLPITLFWAGILLLLIAVGFYATPPAGVGGTPMAMRVPRPPQDVGTLLFQLGVGSTLWYAVVLSIPLLLIGARHIDVALRGWPLTLATALGFLATLAVGTAMVEYALTYRHLMNRPPLGNFLASFLPREAMAWLGAAAAVAAIETRRRTIHSRIEAEALRAAVAEQRLIALAGQLRPHFLLNTLQAISTRMHREPP